MKRCFKCNQLVDNITNVCPQCGGNYFLPERSNQIDSNMVMQQVMPQKNNNMNEASDIYYVLGFFGGIFLPIIIFALILIFTHGEVRRKLRNGALAGILITFVLTILIVQFMH